MDGILNLNKPFGITSRRAMDQVQRLLQVKKAGHGGTLDPNVTGVLPISIGRASKAIKVMQESSKEYICLMKHNSKVGEKSVQKMFKKFIGPIYQIPPLQAAVKRELRIRRIYEIEMLEHTPKNTLFRNVTHFKICLMYFYVFWCFCMCRSRFGQFGIVQYSVRSVSRQTPD